MNYYSCTEYKSSVSQQLTHVFASHVQNADNDDNVAGTSRDSQRPVEDYTGTEHLFPSLAVCEDSGLSPSPQSDDGQDKSKEISWYDLVSAWDSPLQIICDILLQAQTANFTQTLIE